ncbi:tetratricopeptide repeat protein [Sphingomicrobium sp. XHP0235]|uniref:tetratricopeptide repeat protein n=1 Tax=Sphingomicrobium aquimarinum TaxID=3133971 RepID=UPI0031FEE265
MKKQMGKAMAAAALAAGLAACTSATDGMGGFAGNVDKKNIGVAMKAQQALIEGQHGVAIEHAERAVANKPQDAGFRSLLGNAYFAAGRFASAEAAYRDSLELMPAQPQVILKKALVEIAQGKSAQALDGLEQARGYVDAADLGLAVALAGRPQVAIDLLNSAARSPEATARTRQNLALAYAMTGDWQQARTIAAQDVPANQLDAQLQGWMAMANPEHPSLAIAALTGVTPSQVDPGQPIALALVRNENQPRYASLAPRPQPQPQQATPVPTAQPYAGLRTADLAPQQRIALGDAPVTFAKTIEIPVRDITLVDEAAEAASIEEAEVSVATLDVDEVAPVALMAKAVAAARPQVAAPALSSDAVRLTESVRSMKVKAVAAEQASRSVVQLASYFDQDLLAHGWSVATKKVDGLNAFQPMAARFEHDGKTYYRLAAHGFASDADARSFCADVQAKGIDCFVRKMAGDAPTRFARKS